MNTFAERLKYAMEQADLKQSTLSELTGISKPSINQYRSGKNTPGPERVKALADAIGVTFDFLMGYGAAPVKDAQPPVKKISVKEAARCMGNLISLCGSAFSVGFYPLVMRFPEQGTTGITTLTPPSSGSMWALKLSTPSLA